MVTAVIYDSIFRNTEKVAEAIAGELDAILINVNQPKNIKYNEIDFLIIGSPTHGGRPTEEMQKFINSINGIKGKKFAAFDTRSKMKWVKLFGFASDYTALVLRNKGAEQLGEPTGFYVHRKQGPLLDPEITRARIWARNLLNN